MFILVKDKYVNKNLILSYRVENSAVVITYYNGQKEVIEFDEDSTEMKYFIAELNNENTSTFLSD